jgi:SAM-dependent methyltransferase
VALLDVAGLRQSWDWQQGVLEPGREESLSLMLDYVGVLVGEPARVLDLACATGSIAERVLSRFPQAHVTAVDIDPVTLKLARAAFGADPRVDVLERDLRDSAWADELPAPFDAVLTATALHWLHEDHLLSLYRRLGELLRPRGIFANRDHMPIEAEALAEAARNALERHVEADGRGGSDPWGDWWKDVAREPSLAAELVERTRRFSGPTADLLHPVSWHCDRLLQGFFSAAAAVWRWGNDALLVAVR